MPTVFHDGPYSFVFFSSDGAEPPHVHVRRERRIAKFWLDPVTVARNHGFAAHEVNEIVRIVSRYELALLEAWHEHFGS